MNLTLINVTHDAGSMASLLTLPHEILHNILKWVGPIDLARLSCSCHALHSFISSNRSLFKEIVLQKLDGPSGTANNEEPIWEEELHNLVKFQNVMNSELIETKIRCMTFVANIITDYLRTASPQQSSKTVGLLTSLCRSETNRDIFFCSSAIFERARKSQPTESTLTQEQRRLSAKLHCLYGVPIQNFGVTRSTRTYPYACSKVYDLRNYTTNTMWGPFLDDGSGKVDWEMIEAIMIILGHNLRIFSDRTGGLFKPIWAQPFINAVPSSYTSLSEPIQGGSTDPTSLAFQDPYNVSGTWMRLFHYNFVDNNPPALLPRPPLDTGEAIRLILMELTVTKIEPPGEDDGQALPIVHFEGTSRSMHLSFDPNANSNIRGELLKSKVIFLPGVVTNALRNAGTVKLTKEGEIRWTTFSIYHGDFDVHGPAGPTAFWKINDEIDEHGDSEELEDPDYTEDEGDEDEHTHAELILEILT
ncbi:MAG: hypothetical protein M1818_000045 [Claussenomyces sp. TS43310]|nr:MAG: hypothetical protein M1818_000045 [Claussenomyces sp. TS43310]